MNPIKIFSLSFRILLFTMLGCWAGIAQPRASAGGDCVVYVGTYTGAKSEGIYAFRMSLGTGALTPIGLVAKTPNPTFLDLDPQGKFLYAANEIGNFAGAHAGSASAYAIEPGNGKLTFVNSVSTVGSGPCHILVDHTGKDALVANYGSGSPAVLPIQVDGSLGAASAFIQHAGKGPNHQRQEGPHAHCVTLDASNQFAFVCDLGIDKVMIYKFDAAKGTLTPNDPSFVVIKPGSGPRHLAFGKDGRFAYLINELASTVTVFAYDSARGSLHELQTISTLPADFKGDNISAEVVVAPSGRFLYASNRGDDSIATFGINPRQGTLTLIARQPTQGRTPRNFAFDPTGKYVIVADQDSNKLVVFAVAPKIGRLLPTGQEAEVGSPVCVKFMPLR